MEVNGYEITIRKIRNLTHKFNIGDITNAHKSSCGHDNELGVIVEVRGERKNKLSTPRGRGWYYYVEHDGGSGTEREEDLTLILSKKGLFNQIEGLQNERN